MLPDCISLLLYCNCSCPQFFSVSEKVIGCHILSTDEHVAKKVCQLIMSRRHCLALDGGKQLIRWESSDFEVIVQERGLIELSTVEQSGRGVYSTWVAKTIR